MTIYKAFLTIYEGDTATGTSVLCKDFDTARSALTEAKKHMVSDESRKLWTEVEIREYTPVDGRIFIGSNLDTGKTVRFYAEARYGTPKVGEQHV